MRSFLSDCRACPPYGWREAFVISWCYGMGDPLAPSEVEGNREGGGIQGGGRHHPSVTP